MIEILLTFSDFVSYLNGDIETAIYACQNAFWNPISNNPHIANICKDVWIETYPNSFK